MSWYKNYRLVQNGDDYELEIYLDPMDTEFSSEFFDNIRENVLDLDEHVKKFMQDNFKDVKIKTIKLLVGAMVVGTIPLAHGVKAKAETLPTAVPSAQTASQGYNVNLLNTTGTVTTGSLNVRSGPSTSYSSFHVLYNGNQVHVIGESSGWYKIQLSNGKIGFVSGKYIRLEVPTTQQKIDLAISVADSLVGTPYVWGGESLAEGGFDCSGLTQYVFSQAGYTLNRVSTDQATQGTNVPRASISPGDLVFYSLSGDGRISHVGIYVGNGKMIHSPKAGDTVKYTDITTSYWQTRFVTARRIIQ